jgi:hypothetical protein
MNILRFIHLSLFVSAGFAPILVQAEAPTDSPSLAKMPATGTISSCVAIVHPGEKPMSPLLEKRLCAEAKKLMAGTLKELMIPACYSIRDYQFARENPESDVTKLRNYSVCQSSSLFRQRNIATPGR